MSLEGDLQQIVRDKPASVVWVIGTGVPQGALRGTPSEPYTSWAGLLRSGLQRIHELGKIAADEMADHERLLGHDNLTTWLLVAETIAQALGAPSNGEFRRWLRETVGEFEKHLVDRAVLDALAEHQRRGGLLATTNYDFLLETVTGLPAATWRTPADVERALRGDEPHVLHLHGAWRWTDSVVLGIRSYDEVIRDSHARAVLTTLRTGRTFVFVGCGAGLRDPNLGAFLKWTATAYGGSEYRHFRLCRKSELAALRREHPDEQRIFPVSYGDNHAELAPFLRSLLDAHATSGPGVGARAAVVGATTPAPIAPTAPSKPRGPGTTRGSVRPIQGPSINGDRSGSVPGPPASASKPTEIDSTDIPQGDRDKLDVIGYSRSMIGGRHDLGTLRVCRFMGEAKAHVLTAKGWEMRALNEDAEAIIRFALSMRMCRRSIGAKSVDVYPEYRLDVRVSIGHVACEWSTINDVGEPILVDADVVPLAIRCDLLAACAVLPDDQSPSV